MISSASAQSSIGWIALNIQLSHDKGQHLIGLDLQNVGELAVKDMLCFFHQPFIDSVGFAASLKLGLAMEVKRLDQADQITVVTLFDDGREFFFALLVIFDPVGFRIGHELDQFVDLRQSEQLAQADLVAVYRAVDGGIAFIDRLEYIIKLGLAAEAFFADVQDPANALTAIHDGIIDVEHGYRLLSVRDGSVCRQKK